MCLKLWELAKTTFYQHKQWYGWGFTQPTPSHIINFFKYSFFCELHIPLSFSSSPNTYKTVFSHQWTEMQSFRRCWQSVYILKWFSLAKIELEPISLPNEYPVVTFPVTYNAIIKIRKINTIIALYLIESIDYKFYLELIMN